MSLGVKAAKGGAQSTLSNGGTVALLASLSAALVAALVCAGLALRRVWHARRHRPSVLLAMGPSSSGAAPLVIDSSAISVLELAQTHVAGTTTGAALQQAEKGATAPAGGGVALAGAKTEVPSARLLQEGAPTSGSGDGATTLAVRSTHAESSTEATV